ncbi:MAG: hypothetical protein U5K72_05580 [Balneolaceae bacterium]|nr:hypothetical protein [Balneolaceae bacterium]
MIKIRKSKNDCTVPFINVATLCVAILMLMGCSGSSTAPGNESPIPGVYYLRGEKIVSTVSAGNTGEIEQDTTFVLLIVKIQKVENERNRFRFYGLDGADVSEEGNHRVFPECNDPEQCEIYGSIAGEDLLIDVSNGERSYHASGNVYQTYDPYIDIEAEYEYQDVTIHYTLEGDQKVDTL